MSTLFSVNLYTGTGASKTITTANTPDMVWIASRSTTGDPALYDTSRGVTKQYLSDSTNSETTQAQGVTAFGASSFTIGTLANINTNGATYFAWAFTKAPGFFDIVTWTGNGSSQTLSHNLNATPSYIIIFDRDSAGDSSKVWDNSFTLGENLDWQSTSGSGPFANGYFFPLPTSSSFTLSTTLNTHRYCAYLFGASDAISGGSFTTNGSGAATVTTGWQPQLLYLRSPSAGGNWMMLDASRGWAAGADALRLSNTSAAETSSTDYGTPTSTGFTASNLSPSATYIYFSVATNAVTTDTGWLASINTPFPNRISVIGY